MLRQLQKTLLQAIAMAAVACVLSIAFNAVRAEGISLVTDVPYEIFAQCKDSEAESTEATADDLADARGVLYVDARPAEVFAQKHAKGAINVPYSALFGATDEDVKKVVAAAKAGGIKSVVVYGAYTDPENPEYKVDFGKPLSLQLAEAEIEGVKYVEDGLKALVAKGVETEGGAQ